MTLWNKDGHKPLLFFLKSLRKGDARLPQLIKDEIKARTCFILCDSDHSRASPWVQEARLQGSSAYAAARLRHALANAGHDTRSLQSYMGHRNIQNTVRYAALAPDRFKGFWKD